MQNVSSEHQELMKKCFQITTEVLEENIPGKWCISYGTLLGWYRGRKFIPWDDDCDLIILDCKDANQILPFIMDQKLKISSVATFTHDTFLQSRLSEIEDRHEGQTDLFMSYAIDEPLNIKPGSGPMFTRPRIKIPACPPPAHPPSIPFINSTFWSEIEGIKVRVPNSWEEQLSNLYPKYHSIYPDKVRPRVLMDMCADLFHPGHIDIIHRANFYGSVIVGLHADDVIEKYKGRRPAMKLEERAAQVRACKFVYDVIEDLPWVISNEMLEQHKCDYIVRGSDLSAPAEELYPGCVEKLVLLDRYPKISSSQIKDRIK